MELIDKLSRVQQYKSDVAFKSLMEGVNDNLYFIPPYQRAFCWNEEQVQELVRSFVKGYPIPPIYAYRNSKGQLEILDGQQRIMSLFCYYIGRIKKKQSINLKNINIEGISFEQVLEDAYEMKPMKIVLDEDDDESEQIDISYNTLPRNIKSRIDYTNITVIELRWENVNNMPEDIQIIFKNLNRNGTKLEPQEIRNGVYNCPFYDMIRDINTNNEKWRSIWGNSNQKEGDMEFLLRLCTVKKYVDFKDNEFIVNSYPKKYYAWIDFFSAEAQNMKKTDIAVYKRSLEKFFEKISIKKVMSSDVTLLEGLYVVYEKAGIERVFTQELYDEIKNSEDYKKTARQGTVKKSNMSKRWKTIYEILSRTDK